MTARARKGGQSILVRSLELETRSSISRLARSTCCQRPNRHPPERRVSVEPTHRNCLKCVCPRKPFKLTANPGCMSTEIATALLTLVRDTGHWTTDASTQPIRRGARGKSSLGLHAFYEYKPQESISNTKELLEVFAINAKPFEDRCPRMSDSGAGIDFRVVLIGCRQTL